MRLRNNNSFSKKQFLSTKLKIGITVLIIFSLFFLNWSSFPVNIKSFFYSISLPSQRWLWEKGDYLSDFWVSILKTDDKIYGRCSCKDFKYRGRENNFPCKHIIAMCRNAGIEL